MTFSFFFHSDFMGSYVYDSVERVDDVSFHEVSEIDIDYKYGVLENFQN